jgi:hypothetical protein
VKFGLIYEIPVPRPWHDRSAYTAFQDTLEQVMLADRLGFHSVWTVEHHFLDEYSFSSAPGVFYGALAAKTENIRIGHGVRLLPFPYNHPVRAAEAAATVDILSGGRLEFGTGRSGTRVELEGFGIDPNDTRPMWEEALEVVVGCWTQEQFSFDGDYFHLPPRGVVPRPMQQPHPPLWGALSSSDSHELIGEKGIGLLSFSVAAPPESLVKRFNRYRDGIRINAVCPGLVDTPIVRFEWRWWRRGRWPAPPRWSPAPAPGSGGQCRCGWRRWGRGWSGWGGGQSCWPAPGQWSPRPVASSSPARPTCGTGRRSPAWWPRSAGGTGSSCW